MLNKYPLWKTLMVLFIVAFGALYALPNLYPEDPAVQVSGLRGVEANAATLDSVKSDLTADNISFSSIVLENGQLLVRFSDTEQQLRARDLLEESLGDKFSVALNLTPATPAWLASVGGTPMKLGLDLSGGVSFLMEVNMSEAIVKAQDALVDDFRTDLRGEKIRYRSVKKSNDSINVQFRNAEDLTTAHDFLKKRYRDFLMSENADNLTLSAKMTDEKIKEVREYALQQNITIIRNRVNELGVSEPLVQRQGKKHIIIELPGVQDTAKAKEILNATATIEFRLVDTDGDLSAALNGRVPASSKLLYERDGKPVLLKKRVMLTGDHIVDAGSSFDEYSRPQVNISLDSAGGGKMSNGTKSNIGKPMATVFIEYKPTDRKDAEGNTIFEKIEEVISVATIQARLGKTFRITGAGSQSEAHNLALLLRAGALVAPIQIVEERTVGPTLGAENVRLGFEAILMGFGLVFIFMIIYYRAFGVVANLALGANLILIVGVMSLIPGATLTLPGMAGIVLTVGMAVDANVLIFERIREEIREGKSIQQSIHQGYEAAFSTIIDANITTLIAALILYAVGTGPIKGFAITLSIGILTSMFTAVVGTRTVVNAVWGGKRLDKLSI
ncbi:MULTISPECIES: protein translocase subunit SecD [unclassified Colwellia]|uniref:protein translocase subunit SecD n=1 Tax=unclassified Colwellia TaxID=196834 RepID=UPI0015F6A9DF|nr:MULTISPECIES: protein translocase subunit SecD [unclassified Colwellia]MBA6337209.1 protein translocase subunit SecD [Colwellia sp. BRX8-7]MBA6357878.1 protein translocase subunit SecD [Colwellia sp. BRX8-3]MBA6360443.1 protein translocase subunit SecD [Colwellia sp. BRX8-6]MBA6368766.1 protein translocase subunit SecD [Colwellia sp. BRX8-5]MBA6371884.1 protein translocase subunit SecD [Colwellia sp. BRX8-4]